VRSRRAADRDGYGSAEIERSAVQIARFISRLAVVALDLRPSEGARGRNSMAGKGRAESAGVDEQDTKRAIAGEARRILDSDGLGGLSVRAAAKAAGLS